MLGRTKSVSQENPDLGCIKRSKEERKKVTVQKFSTNLFLKARHGNDMTFYAHKNINMQQQVFQKITELLLHAFLMFWSKLKSFMVNQWNRFLLFQECIWQAKQHLSSFIDAVSDADQFLRNTEVSLLPPQGPTGPCREFLKETQRVLTSFERHFQTYIEQLQNCAASSKYLCPEKLKLLHETVVSHLLVRSSTLQAQGHVKEESLSRWRFTDYRL